MRLFGVELTRDALLFPLIVGTVLAVPLVLFGNRGDPLAVGTVAGVVGAMFARTVLDAARGDSRIRSSVRGFARKKAVDYVVMFVGFVVGALAGSAGLSIALAVAG